MQNNVSFTAFFPAMFWQKGTPSFIVCLSITIRSSSLVSFLFLCPFINLETSVFLEHVKGTHSMISFLIFYLLDLLKIFSIFAFSLTSRSFKCVIYCVSMLFSIVPQHRTDKSQIYIFNHNLIQDSVSSLQLLPKRNFYVDHTFLSLLGLHHFQRDENGLLGAGKGENLRYYNGYGPPRLNPTLQNLILLRI